MPNNKVLITEADVLRAFREGQTTIEVEGEPMLTPLAASSVKEYGMEIVVLPGAQVQGEGTPVLSTGLDRSFLLNLYRTMQRIRAFETAVSVLLEKERIPGFAHLSIGQEAVPTGACAALREDDYLTLTHRGHGQMLARGAQMDLMMAELYGKSTGYCKGKGGSVHLADFERGILGANGIVGAGIAIATGAALSAKIRGTDQVALAFFGDGAVNQGAFHESLNLASLWRLPVIFLCENNLYAVSTPVEKAVSSESIVQRAQAYNMPATCIDGNDVLAMCVATEEAVSRARKGEGPTLMECLTYRFRGHWEGETKDLRPRSEVEEWKKRDPIRLFELRLIREGVAAEDDLRRISDEVCQELSEAIAFAETSPYPRPEEAMEDVVVPL